ncbi:MAG TPA: MFS transporter [Gemmataceae bacterium]|nr:MFS transporter [Gemmataceae bacterium]
MWNARLRLGSLWLSQVARNVADHCLRLYVILKTAESGAGSQRESAWHWVIALFAFPAVILAPCNGAIGNSLPKRWVLSGSAAYCFAVVLIFALGQGPWLWGLGLVAVGSAVYFPTRYALLAAATKDTQLPAPRVNGLIEMGAVSGIIAGTILGVYLYNPSLPQLEITSADPVPAVQKELGLAIWGVPGAVAVAIGMNLLGVLTAIPVSFAADVRRPERPSRAIGGFFQDWGRIWRKPEARGPLLAWAAFRGLVAAITGALVAIILKPSGDTGQREFFFAVLGIAVWVLLGAAVGSLLAGFQGHPRRSLGIVPFAATGLLAILVWTAATSFPGWKLCFLVGIFGGMINVPLYSAFQDALPADARGNGMAILNMAGNLCMGVMALMIGGLAGFQILSPTGQMFLVAGLTTVGMLVAWKILYRESIEQVMEIILWPIYRMRGFGPGLASCPRTGPVLVVANHSSWFDPLFLAKVIPRRIIPMMTSVFFDLPVMKWLMVNVVHAIRVADSPYRREVPELQQAIAALDRGECVIIFPEGRLRRKPEQFLRKFGQGAWHILRERPHTPVVICWIEGGWGSYFSYWNGPPTQNKRMDCWRHMDIAVKNPEILSPELLADIECTRQYLMKSCAEARGILGLEVPGEALEAAKDAEDEDSEPVARASG